MALALDLHIKGSNPHLKGLIQSLLLILDVYCEMLYQKVFPISSMLGTFYEGTSSCHVGTLSLG